MYPVEQAYRAVAIAELAVLWRLEVVALVLLIALAILAAACEARS